MPQAARPIASSLLHTALPALGWLLFVALAAWLVSGWYWRWAGPQAEAAIAAPIVDPLAAAGETASRHLFGLPATQLAAQSGAAAPSFMASRYKVLGVAAHSRGKYGFAIIQQDGEAPMPVREGQELAPGVVISRILPGGIELDRSGTLEMLPLTQGDGASPAVPGQFVPTTRNFAPPPAPPTAFAPGQPQQAGVTAPAPAPGVPVADPSLAQ